MGKVRSIEDREKELLQKLKEIDLTKKIELHRKELRELRGKRKK